MKKAKALTLIELLTVLAVIALLISILLPSLRRAKQSALSTVCLNRIRQICLAQHGYADENDDCFTPCYNDDPDDPNKVWQIRLKNYLPLTDVNGWNTKDRADVKSVHCCPSAHYTDEQKNYCYASYGLNNFLTHPNWFYEWLRVRRPSDIILVRDMEEYPYDVVGTSDEWFWWGWMPRPLPGFRHLGNGNMGFVDGHVKPLSEEELRVDSGHWKWW